MKPKAFLTSSAVVAFAAISLAAGSSTANSSVHGSNGVVDPSLYSGLVWRNIGPFRGGRVSAVCGAIGQPGTYYAGMPAGGVWKTTNGGITWDPIFDAVKTASGVGAVQVAPSDPNIVYVGLGDPSTGGGHNEGDGVYKSIDAGKTWTHIGLEFAKQVPSILVDEKDPNIVLVAVLGDAKTAGPNRGAYRSTDGGKTWKKTLLTDHVTGVQRLARADDHPQVILATTQRHCNTGSGGDDPKAFKNTAIVKSEDGGLTWKQLKGSGLPEFLSGKTCIAVAMNTQAQRIFFVSGSGLWRSDDGGASWKQMDKEDGRIRNGQGGYNCGVYVNSKDPDTVYVINTCSYISRDGGKTFAGFKGAPGGDDPQQMWIDPKDGNRLFLGGDQGPAVSLDGGKSWSTWYNIANGQFYHIATSNSWPYWIYATMQDSGCIGMSSRGNYGELTFLDWSPNPGWEWGSITVDPLNPNTIYSTGQSNDVIKQSFPSAQWVSVSPDNDPRLKLRHDINQPIMFSPVNPHELFLGYQFLMSSTDGAKTWHKLSPDLSFPKGYVAPKPESEKPQKKNVKKDPKKVAQKTDPKKRENEKAVHQEVDADAQDGTVFDPKEAMERAQEMADEEMQRGGGGGAISSLSPSSLDGGIIWAGMSTGTIKLTHDHGKNWDDVVIPGVKRSIACIDSSHTDPASAYVVVSSTAEPIVYRTKDFGKTWTKIVQGLPTDEPTGSWATVVRADTKKDGLLFLGTESTMYVSFDDGSHWQSLRLNLPNTSYRDMLVKDNDLVVGTYGRSFWILDDLSPLRQISSVEDSSYLFAPGDAVRARRNVNQDTPMPPEVPHALNAPPGALVYYYLGSQPSSFITLDVTDSNGKTVRHYSSAPLPPTKEGLQPFPDFWKEVPKPMPTEIGTNRMNWDLRYDNPAGPSRGYDISATPNLTPVGPLGPLVLPGVYTLTLTVDGKKSVQKVRVKNDPRSPASGSDLVKQHEIQMALYDGNARATVAAKAQTDLKSKISELQALTLPKDIGASLTKLDDELDVISKNTVRKSSFGSMPGQCISYLAKLDFGDMAPSQPVCDAVNIIASDLKIMIKTWNDLQEKDIKALNEKLSKAGLALLPVNKI